MLWYAVKQLVDVLRYKPEDRGFDSRRIEIFHSLNLSGRIMARGSIQNLT
jgi:hypothetical protein